MSCQALDELKQQIPLLDYLQAHDWRPVRQLSRGRWMGLCPLHSDHKPSFLVDVDWLVARLEETSASASCMLRRCTPVALLALSPPDGYPQATGQFSTPPGHHWVLGARCITVSVKVSKGTPCLNRA